MKEFVFNYIHRKHIVYYNYRVWKLSTVNYSGYSVFSRFDNISKLLEKWMFCQLSCKQEIFLNTLKREKTKTTNFRYNCQIWERFVENFRIYRHLKMKLLFFFHVLNIELSPSNEMFYSFFYTLFVTNAELILCYSRHIKKIN